MNPFLSKSILFLTLTLLVLTAQLFYPDYSSFIALLNEQSFVVYDAPQITTHLSAEGYTAFKTIVLTLSISFVFILVFFSKKIMGVIHTLLHFAKEIKYYSIEIVSTLKTLSLTQSIIILSGTAIALIHSFYRLYTIPLLPDEVFSYVFFIKPAFWMCSIYYPEPNNHVLFNLIANFFDLFINDPILCLRLPSLLFYFLTLGVIFIFTFRKFGFLIAITAFILCAFSLNAVFYAAQGRGYMLLSFFAILATFSLFKYIEEPGKIFFLQLFVLCSVLGAYTIPVFFFPFASLILYAIATGRNQPVLLKNLFLAILSIGVLVFLLYLPILTLNGTHALLANKWVHAKGLHYLFDIFPVATVESINYILGVSSKGYWIVALVLGGLVYLYLRKTTLVIQKNWMTLLFFSLISIAFLLLILRTFPPYRVWTYLIFLCNITWAIGFIALLSISINNYKVKCTLITLACVAYALFMINQSSVPPKEVVFYSDLNALVENMYRQSPKSIYISQHELPEYYLRLKYLNENKPLTLDIKQYRTDYTYDYVILYTHLTPLGIDMSPYVQVAVFDDAVVYKNQLFKH